jgi:hypothetical protein
MKKILLFIFIFSLAAGSSNAQLIKKHDTRKGEKGLFVKIFGNRRATKVKEPRAVLKAKKKQEANDKKLKRDYVKSTKASQKRTYDIQTPEVQARMKQNQKESASKEKVKKKKVKQSTKKAGKKYN